jgi:hypothetical protein
MLTYIKSLIHSLLSYLENQNPMDSKDRPGVLPVPYYTHCHMFHYKGCWYPYKPFARFCLGSVLATRYYECRHYHDFSNSLPSFLCGKWHG